MNSELWILNCELFVVNLSVYYRRWKRLHLVTVGRNDLRSRTINSKHSEGVPHLLLGDRFQGRKYPFHSSPQILWMLRLLRGDAFSVIPNLIPCLFMNQYFSSLELSLNYEFWIKIFPIFNFQMRIVNCLWIVNYQNSIGFIDCPKIRKVSVFKKN